VDIIMTNITETETETETGIEPEVSNVNSQAPQGKVKRIPIPAVPLTTCQKAYIIEMNALKSRHNHFISKASTGFIICVVIILIALGVFYLKLKQSTMEVTK
jgi:hypothetical protein